MQKIENSVMKVMEEIWQKNKKNFSLKELEALAKKTKEPFCFWAQKEIKKRKK